MPTPLTIGHEFMGHIVEVGKEVTQFQIGDRVAGEGHITCGHCRHCQSEHRHLCPYTQGLGITRPGAFAEYVALPESNCLKIPPEIEDDIAAILDPLGNAIHTSLTFNLTGEDILIMGAGPIGIMAAAIAHHAGASHVVVADINDYRLSLAKQLGATTTINTEKDSLESVIHNLHIKEFQIGLEMSGHSKALNQMLDILAPGGQIALLGIPPAETSLNFHHIIFKGLTLKGIYGRKMFETWFKMLTLLQSGLNIKPVITHHFPYHDFEKAFALIKSGQSGKVILNWE